MEHSKTSELLRTPLSRLVRGKTGPEPSPLAGLPEPLRALGGNVVRRTRLRRGEKRDVALELASHFGEGLGSGRTAEDLVESFGDPKAAAKLIRRSVKRKRGPVWKAWVLTWCAVAGVFALVLLAYSVAFVRFHTAEAAVEIDYIAKLNEGIRTLPPERRSAELLEAIGGFQSAATSKQSLPVADLIGLIQPEDTEGRRLVAALLPTPMVDQEELWSGARPASASGRSDRDEDGIDDWEEAKAALERSAAAIDLVMAAAHREGIGVPLRSATEDGQGPVLNVLLPHLGALRASARLLGANAVAAAERGDAETLERSIDAQLRLAGQARESAFIIGDLVAIAVASLAMDDLSRCIELAPGLLDEATLARLAHSISTWEGGGPLVRYDTERFFMADAVQRSYSPSGVYLGLGWADIDDWRASDGMEPLINPTAARVLGGPANALIAADREDIERIAERFYANAERMSATPPWRWTQDMFDSAELWEYEESALAKARYQLLAYFLPSLHRASWAGHQAEAKRGAVLAAIACEVHRQRSGAWPATLEDLTPALLPVVPRDPFTGEPMRFAVRRGLPYIYSVGVDRDDDDGFATDAAWSWQTKEWLGAQRAAGELVQPDGDMVLFPVDAAQREQTKR